MLVLHAVGVRKHFSDQIVHAENDKKFQLTVFRRFITEVFSISVDVIWESVALYIL